MQKQRIRSNPKTGKKPANLKITTDLRGGVFYVSEALLALTGQTRKSIKNTALKNLIHPASARKVLALLQEKGPDTAFREEVALKGKKERVTIEFKGLPDKRNGAVQKKARSTFMGASVNEVFERISDAFIALDKDFRYTYANRKACEVLGHSAEELIGRIKWEVFPATVGTPFYDAYVRSFRDQEYVYLEDYYPAFDRWYENHIYPSPEGITVYFRDVTEKKKTELNLKRSNHFLKAAHMELHEVIENATEIIYKIDQTGKLLFVSPEFERSFGFKIGELSQYHFEMVVHPDDWMICYEAIRRAVETRMPVRNVMYRVRTNTGDWRTLRTSLSFLFKEDGSPLYAIGMSLDITELQVALKRAESAEQRYSVFLQNSTEAIYRIETPEAIDVNSSFEEMMAYYASHAFLAECNNAYARLFGYEHPEDLIGTPITVLQEPHESMNLELVRKFYESGFNLSDGVTLEYDRQGNRKYFLNNLIGIVEDGKLVRVWGIQRDITELKTTQEQLIKSEERYRAFIQQSTEAIWRGEITEPINVLDDVETQVQRFFKNAYLAECNDHMAEMYGFRDAQQLIGAKLEDFVNMTSNFTSDIARKFVTDGYKLLRGPSVQIDKYGRKRYFLNNLFGIIENGFVTRIWGVQTDVTEQRLAEKALKSSEERYRAFIQQSSEGIWRVEAYPVKVNINISPDEIIDIMYKHGVITECNDAFAAMYGYEKAEELLGAPLEKLLPKNDPVNQEYLRAFIASGYRLENVESRERDKYGNEIYINNSLIGIIEKGHLVRVWGTQKNITNLKLAEKLIKNREEQYRTLAENVPGMIFQVNNEFRITYVNQMVKKTFNLPPDIFVGKTPYELGISKELWNMLQSKGRKVYQTGKPDTFTFKLPSQSRPGQNYNLLMNLTPERDPSGEVKSIIVIANEITPLIEAQEKLEHKDRLLSTIAELTSDLLKAADYEQPLEKAVRMLGEVMGVDRGFVLENMLDNPEQKAAIKHLWVNQKVPGNHPEALLSTLSYAGRDENYQLLCRNEIVVVRVDQMGTAHYRQPLEAKGVRAIILVPILMGSELWGVLGFISLNQEHVWSDVEKDILKTYASSLSNAIQRKRSEEIILESEARFKQLADYAPVMIWVSDKSNTTTYVNKNWTHFTGLTLEQLNEMGWDDLVHPDDLKLAVLDFDEHFARYEPILLEYRLKNSAGEYRWILDQSIPRFLADGTFMGYVGSVIDIHDRKLTEEKIRFQARVMQEVSEAIVAVDMDFLIVTWNKGAETIYGLPADEVIGKRMDAVIQQEYLNDTLESSLDHINKYGFWSGEVYTDRKDGKRIYLHSSVTFLTDENGNRRGFVGINRDITDRKKADDALRNSEERYRSVVNALGEGIILFDREGKIITINRSAELVINGGNVDLTGRKAEGEYWNILSEDGSPYPLDKLPYLITLNNGKSLKNVILGINRPDEGKIWLSVNTEPIYYSAQRQVPDAVVASFVDITQKRQAEWELKKNEKQLREYSERINIILSSITDGFIALDNTLRVILWNKVIENTFAIRADEAMGRNFFDLMPRVNLGLEKAFKEAVEQKEGFNREIYSAERNMWVEVTGFPSSQGLFVFFRDITKRKRQELQITLEKEVLEMNARPQNSLKATTDYYLLGLEKIFPGMLSSVLLLQEDTATIETLSAPSLPEEYSAAINGLPIGPYAGSCGTAMFHKKNVIVGDIDTDALWADYREIAKKYSLGACWSYVIMGAQEKVLATFAIYNTKPQLPTEEEISTLERAVNILRVIIENKLAEEKIKVSNERYLLATMATNDAIWDMDLGTRTIYWGEGFHTLFGYKAGYYNDLEGIWEKNIHPQDRDRVVKSMEDFIASHSQQVWQDEYRFRRADGQYATVTDHGFLIYSQQGKVSRMVGSMQDVTEKRELEKKLLNQEINKQKMVAQAVVEAQEKERSLIGKELHDNVNQILSTTKLYIEVARSDEKERDNLMEMSMQNIADAINEIRTISRSLVPASIGDLGLAESISDLVESIKITRKLNVEFYQYADLESLLNEQQKLMLFRIVQEQVNNVIKHAAARNLIIELSEEDNAIHMSITDDGKGFDTDQVKQRKGLGLTNIMSRAELFNGRVDIIAAPGKGCTLTVHIPIVNS